MLSYLLILVGIGAFVYGVYMLWQQFVPPSFEELQQATRVSAAESVNEDGQLHTVQLMIPTRDIHVPVMKGAIDQGEWEVSKHVALMIEKDVDAGLGAVVYAHNTQKLFGKLESVKAGDVVELTLNDWSVEKYEVVETKVVSPDQVDAVLTASVDEIVLYTCVGFLDGDRLLVRAKLLQ